MGPFRTYLVPVGWAIYNILSFFIGLVLSIGIVVPMFCVWIVFWVRSRIVQRRWEKQGYEMFTGHDATMGHFPEIMINNILLLPEVPEVTMVHKQLRVRLADLCAENGRPLMPKFLQTMENKEGYMFWKDVPREKQDSPFHIFNYQGKPPTTEEELHLLLSDLHRRPIPDCNPAWQIIQIPLQGQLKESGKGCCVLMRVHHAIADGVSLIRVLLQHLADDPTVFNHATAMARAKLHETTMVKIFRRVASFPSLFQVVASQVVRSTNVFHGPELSGQSVCTWRSYKLDYIKSIKNSTNTTINDVLMSCMAGAMRRFCIWTGSPIPSTMKVFLPIALHLPESIAETNNAFSYVTLNIYTGTEDPRERLTKTKTAMDKLKRSPEAIVNYIIIHTIVPCFPKWFIQLIHDWTDTGTIFASNINGPQESFQYLGQKVLGFFPVCHHHQRMGVAFGFFGYDGQLTVSCSIDKVLCPTYKEIQILMNFFEMELNELTNKALLQNNNK